MRNRFLDLVLTSVVAFTFAPATIAQNIPDIAGLWTGPVGGGGGGGNTGQGGVGRRRWTEANPPLQPWAAAILRPMACMASKRPAAESPGVIGLPCSVGL